MTDSPFKALADAADPVGPIRTTQWEKLRVQGSGFRVSGPPERQDKAVMRRTRIHTVVEGFVRISSTVIRICTFSYL